MRRNFFANGENRNTSSYSKDELLQQIKKTEQDLEDTNGLIKENREQAGSGDRADQAESRMMYSQLIMRQNHLQSSLSTLRDALAQEQQSEAGHQLPHHF
ncbi:hypothetical protein [Legionella spiritensis]|uniref:hypothetical protein n=1 Tax=Legionella spiritensis TaxID=452 RepID=UPI000F6D9663|nr:hypothetical protein [Legionella spiritensis]VEG90677.1 Uncharacterised protein [Legionella spiritensis]